MHKSIPRAVLIALATLLGLPHSAGLLASNSGVIAPWIGAESPTALRESGRLGSTIEREKHCLLARSSQAASGGELFSFAVEIDG